MGWKSWICLTSEQKIPQLYWEPGSCLWGVERREGQWCWVGLVSFCLWNIIPRKMVFLGRASSHGKGKQMKSNEAHNYIMKNNKMHFLICTTSDQMTLLKKLNVIMFPSIVLCDKLRGKTDEQLRRRRVLV